jgi:hypothetical protein
MSAVSSSLVHPSLTADMRLALLAEFGARSLYARLAPRMRDAELARVLSEFVDEETRIIETLSRLLGELGATNVPARSRRRALWSWCLAVTARGRASSMALRACIDSESVIARWYGEYARYLAGCGALGPARTCEELAGIKLRHATILGAWVPR